MEQRPEEVAQYLEQIKDIPVETIAYVDETGIDQYLYRTHGWAKKGERFVTRISGKKYKRTGVVAAKQGSSIVAPMQYDGTMNSLLFEAWFENMLLPSLSVGSTVVMDNAAFHRKAKLFAIAAASNVVLIFLPPHSPELNPIEHFWSWIKDRLRLILHSFDSFDLALSACFNV